jgi:hypothetical protein
VPVKLAGHGRQSLALWFDRASWLVNTKHDGSSDFAVVLYDEKGEQVKELANGKGKLLTLSIEHAGTYSVDVAADGNWTIAIRGCVCAPPFR